MHKRNTKLVTQPFRTICYVLVYPTTAGVRGGKAKRKMYIHKEKSS